MFNHYYIKRVRTNSTTETDFFGFSDEVKFSSIDKCFFTADEKSRIFKRLLDLLWYYEDKYNTEGDKVTATIDTNGEIITVEAVYQNGKVHFVLPFDFID